MNAGLYTSHAVEYSQLQPFNLRWRKKRKQSITWSLWQQCWSLSFLWLLVLGSSKRKYCNASYNQFQCTLCYS